MFGRIAQAAPTSLTHHSARRSAGFRPARPDGPLFLTLAERFGSSAVAVLVEFVIRVALVTSILRKAVPIAARAAAALVRTADDA